MLHKVHSSPTSQSYQYEQNSNKWLHTKLCNLWIKTKTTQIKSMWSFLFCFSEMFLVITFSKLADFQLTSSSNNAVTQLK